MSTPLRVVLVLVLAVGLAVAGALVFPPEPAAVELAAEDIGLGPVSNALLTSFIISAVLIVAAFLIGRNLKERPGGLQSIVEALVELLEGLVRDVAPAKWAPKFFPILATLFIYLLVSNWFSILTPFLAGFGVVHEVGAQVPALHADDGTTVEAGNSRFGIPILAVIRQGDHPVDPTHSTIIPLLRAPTSDLNLTFALAIMAMLLVQWFGFRARGIGYLGSFFRFGGLRKKGLLMWFIDVFVGFLELVEQFSKTLSFAFRLFGNIFAGEVVLIVISSLLPLVGVLPFLGLELFVGIIQSLVFFLLSLVFMSLATEHH